MNKILIYIITLLCPLLIYSQVNKDKLIYKADGFFVTQIDVNGNEKELPFGKNPGIEYDVFFKSYKLTFIDREGRNGQWNFAYLGVEDNGMIRAKDRGGNIVHIIDRLAEQGKFIIMSEIKDNEPILFFHLENAKKE